MPKYVYKTPNLSASGGLEISKIHYFAYADGARPVPVASVPAEKLKFIAGLWRVQNEFSEKIQLVRGKEFVLRELLPKQENNFFEYYRAAAVSENCYGKYASGACYIVAKYDAGGQTYWAYGTSISDARAFLGIKLYDAYQHVIHQYLEQEKNR